MRKTVLLALQVVPVIALLSCATSSTKVASTWKAPGGTSAIKKVLVVGVAGNPGTRKEFETQFADQLGKHGVTAIPSFTVFPGEKIPDRNAAEATIKERGIDTVLVTRVTDKKDVQTYVPGTASPYADFWGFYGYGMGYAYTPGYIENSKQAVLETNLYNASTQQLEWTATSNTTTEGSNTDAIKSFINAIVTKMANEKLIK